MWVAVNIAHLLSVAPEPLDVPVKVEVPLFGTIGGTVFGYAELSLASGTPVTMCYGNVYGAADVACGDETGALLGHNNTFDGTIDGVVARVQLQDVPPPSAWVTGPFGTRNMCLPHPSVLGAFLCGTHADAAVRVDTSGNMVVWAGIGGSGAIETSLVAMACVIALAVVLPYSKRLNTSISRGNVSKREFIQSLDNSTRRNNASRVTVGQDGNSLPWKQTTPALFSDENMWLSIAVSDTVVASSWLVMVNVSRHGVYSVVNPVSRAVLSQHWIMCVGLGKCASLLFASTLSAFLLLSGTHSVETRAATELALLLVMTLLAPLHAAPEYHALFEASTAAAMLVIAGRDAMSTHKPLMAWLLPCFTVASTCASFIPTLVTSNALPRSLVLPVSASAVLQLLIVGALQKP